MRKKLIAVIGAIGVSSMLLSACGNVRISIETDKPTTSVVSVPPETHGESIAESVSPGQKPETESAESVGNDTNESRITPPADALTPAEKEDSSTAAPAPVESAAESVQTNAGSDRQEHPLTNSSLTPLAEKALESIDTDYHKVDWGAEYCADKLDGIVISVAQCTADRNMLVIGFTNLYDRDVTIEAKGYAKDKNDNNVGDIYVFQSAVRPGQTVIRNQYCENESDGRIHWDKVELCDVNDKSVGWECDTKLVTEPNGFYDIAYHITPDNEKIRADYVWALLLDEDGYIVRSYDGYNSDTGYTVDGAIKTSQKSMGGVKDIAFFANVHKAS